MTDWKRIVEKVKEFLASEQFKTGALVVLASALFVTIAVLSLGLLLRLTRPATPPLIVTPTSSGPSTPIPTLTVGPVLPLVYVFPAQGLAGTQIGITGQGFQPGEQVWIGLSSADVSVPAPTVYAEATTQADGVFSTAFVFPDEQRWVALSSVSIIATGRTSGAQAAAPFALQAPVSPTPTLDTPTPQVTVTPTPTLTLAPSTPTSTPTPTAIPPSPTATSTPAMAQWRGEYFSNPSVSGTPALVRYDTAIDFDWSLGAPSPNLPADGFSVRWTRALPVTAGTYRFSLTVDDGARLWVDDQLVLDRWRTGTQITEQVVVPLTAGEHTLRLDYFDDLGSAVVKLSWQLIDSNVYLNWRGEYFSTSDLSGQLVGTRDDLNVNFDWGTGAPASNMPADNFSVRWARSYNFNPAGVYRFYLMVDDGARFYVDNTLLLDEWHQGSARLVQADYYLTQGPHNLRLEYFDAGGQATVALWWSLPASLTQWTGNYHANPNLAIAPVVVRNDDNLTFNWGNGSPDARLPVDGFSARWTRTQFFDAGVYRFTLRVDDGARVAVDGQTIIDEWRDGATRTRSVDVSLAAGNHTLQVDYYERAGLSEISLGWEAFVPTATSSPTPIPPSPTSTPVLPTPTFTSVPPSPTSTPVLPTVAPPTATSTSAPLTPTVAVTALPVVPTDTAVPPTGAPDTTPPTATETPTETAPRELATLPPDGQPEGQPDGQPDGQPMVMLMPAEAVPGDVVLAVGEDWPPMAQIIITLNGPYSPTLNNAYLSTTTADNGQFDLAIPVPTGLEVVPGVPLTVYAQLPDLSMSVVATLALRSPSAEAPVAGSLLTNTQVITTDPGLLTTAPAVGEAPGALPTAAPGAAAPSPSACGSGAIVLGLALALVLWMSCAAPSRH